MNEDILIQHVLSKCYEVSNLKELYEDYKSKVIKCSHDLETGSEFWVNGIGNVAEQMNKCYNQYTQGYRDISQLCHLLGGDYLECFKSILGEGEKHETQ